MKIRHCFWMTLSASVAFAAVASGPATPVQNPVVALGIGTVAEGKAPTTVHPEFNPRAMGCSPAPLTCGASRSGNLGCIYGHVDGGYQYQDLYSLHGEAGQTVHIDAETSTDHEIYFSVGGSPSEVAIIDYERNAHSFSETYSVLREGTYTIQVLMATPPGEASYTLTVSCTPTSIPSRRRSVRQPDSSLFRNAYVHMLTPTDTRAGITLLLPLDNYGLEDPKRYMITLSTRFGEVIYAGAETYCFCTLPSGADWVSNIFMPLPNKFPDSLPPESMPGVIQYKYSFSSPWQGMLVRGEVSFDVWVDDPDHWHPTGGPVSSVEKLPSGAVVVHGVFLTPPAVRIYDPVTDQAEVLAPTGAGGTFEIPPNMVGVLPKNVSVCSAISALKPSSLHCSILFVQ
jgi:hypothetical protein